MYLSIIPEFCNSVMITNSKFNPVYALELCYEELNRKESASFIDLCIAPLWLNQKARLFH